MNPRMPGFYDSQQSFVPAMYTNTTGYNANTNGTNANFSTFHDLNRPIPPQAYMQASGNPMYFPGQLQHGFRAPAPMFLPRMANDFQRHQMQFKSNGDQSPKNDGSQKLNSEELIKLQHYQEQKQKFKQMSGGIGAQKIDPDAYAKKLLSVTPSYTPVQKKEMTPPVQPAMPQASTQPVLKQNDVQDEDGFGEFLSYPAAKSSEVSANQPSATLSSNVSPAPVLSNLSKPNIVPANVYKKTDLNEMMMKYSDIGSSSKASSFPSKQPARTSEKASAKVISPQGTNANDEIRQINFASNGINGNNLASMDQHHQFATRLPFWLMNSSQLPEIYHSVVKMSCGPDGLIETELVYPILIQSNLSRDVLRHLWSLCNCTVPGRLTKIELCTLLALIGLAQANAPVLSVEVLSKLGTPPIPRLGLMPVSFSDSSNVSIIDIDQTSAADSIVSVPSSTQLALGDSVTKPVNHVFGLDHSPSANTTSGQFSINAPPGILPWSEQKIPSPTCDPLSVIVPPGIPPWPHLSNQPDSLSVNVPSGIPPWSHLSSQPDPVSVIAPAGILPWPHPSSQLPHEPVQPIASSELFSVSAPSGIVPWTNQAHLRIAEHHLPQDVLNSDDASLTFSSNVVLSSELQNVAASSNKTQKTNEDKYAALRVFADVADDNHENRIAEEQGIKPASSFEIRGHLNEKNEELFIGSTSFSNGTVNVIDCSSTSGLDDEFGDFASFGASTSCVIKNSVDETAGLSSTSVLNTRKLSVPDTKPTKLIDIDSKLSSVKALVMNNLLYSKPSAHSTELLDFDNSVSSAAVTSFSSLSEAAKVDSDKFGTYIGVDWANSNDAEINKHSSDSVQTSAEIASNVDDIEWADFSSLHSSDTSSSEANKPEVTLPEKSKALYTTSPSAGQSLFDIPPSSLAASSQIALSHGQAEALSVMHDVLQINKAVSLSTEKKSPHVDLFNEPNASKTVKAVNENAKGKKMGSKSQWPSSAKQISIGIGLSPLDMLPPDIDDDIHQSDDWGDFATAGEGISTLSSLNDFDIYTQPIQLDKKEQEIKRVASSPSVSWEVKKDDGIFNSSILTDQKLVKSSSSLDTHSSISSDTIGRIGVTVSDEEKSVASLDLRPYYGDSELEGSNKEGTTSVDDTAPETASQSSAVADTLSVSKEFATLSDRYSSLIGEPLDVERHIYVWKQCLHECHNVIEEACSFVNSCPSATICREVFSNSMGVEYIEGIAEIYMVSHRIFAAIKATATVDSRLASLTASLLQAWTILCDLMAALNLQMPKLDLDSDFVLPKSLAQENVQQQCSCGVCLLDVDKSCDNSKSSNKLIYGGRQYHAPCANFWVNYVDSTLPALTIPVLF